MAVYGFVAKLMMTADSELPASETAYNYMCVFTGTRNDKKNNMSHKNE